MLEGTNLIKRANELNQSYYKLKEVTQRVLAIAIEQAQDIERQTGENLILNGTKVIVCADYYAKVYGVDLNTAYDALKVAVKDMYYAEYVWEALGNRGKMNQYRTRFVSHIGYLNGESSIEFVLTEMARQHIYNLTRNFTIYEIKNLSNLGKYGIRLYELLAQWRSVGKVEFEMEDFRLKLGVDPFEYTHISNFKRRVLDFAVAEINEHTDINVTYEQIKRGRSIKSFLFNFKEKKTKKVISKCPQTIDMFEQPLDTDTFIKMSDSQIDTFSVKLTELSEVQKMAHAGEEMKPFIARVRLMLKDPEKQKKLLPYLNQIGFKSYKS